MTAKRGRTKVSRKIDRAGAHDEQQRGVDQGGDDGLAELPRPFEVLGEAAERDLEHAAALAGPDGVHVEARERPRLVASQRVGEGRAGPDALRHVLHDLPEPPAGGHVAQDDQGPLERQARLDERGELLREVEDVARRHARRAEQPPPGPAALVGGLDPERVVVLAVEALDHRVRVVRFHHAVDRPAGAVGRPVGEDRH